MAAPYFENFPELNYSNTICRDLTRRSVFNLNSPTIGLNYYPYEIESHLRTDQLAEYYYEEPRYEWAVMMANEIIDPYYGWYNTEETFQELIKQKYGDLVTAQKTIKYYINNWADDFTELSVGYHNNQLEEDLKKYWRPVYRRPTEIVAYRRREDNVVRNTNKIIEYQISANNTNVGMINNELVDIKSTGDETVSSNGQIVTSNSSMIRVMNVTGNTFANSTIVRDLVGQTSGANVSVDESATLFENISNTEFAYYTAVSFYDYEVEMRERNKNINLIGDGEIDGIAQAFERVMLFDVDPDTGRSTG